MLLGLDTKRWLMPVVKVSAMLLRLLAPLLVLLLSGSC